ncbi:septal ring lytic transglycosylase RlpA family protein [Beggiatoa leptomitoformis]|nr:septal ring lytic transglycosylase RlpA family protein [Beggiatoa leptomitoformis]
MDKSNNLCSLLIILTLSVSSCASTTPTPAVIPTKRASTPTPSKQTVAPLPSTITPTPSIAYADAYHMRGNATWYDLSAHGMQTASGEIYDLYKMTAAHATLPLNSRVQVTYLQTGRSVIVTINDRLTDNRTLIRLAHDAAKRLGLVGQTNRLVEVRLLNNP